MKRARAPRSSHRPLRTCLGCRQADLKSALVRLSAHGGGVHLDISARMNGRGGYLHARKRCLALFVAAKCKTFVSLGRGLGRVERQALARTLEHLVSLSDKA